MEEMTRPAGSAATEMWEPVGRPGWPVLLAGKGLK